MTAVTHVPVQSNRIDSGRKFKSFLVLLINLIALTSLIRVSVLSILSLLLITIPPSSSFLARSTTNNPSACVC